MSSLRKTSHKRKEEYVNIVDGISSSLSNCEKKPTTENLIVLLKVYQSIGRTLAKKNKRHFAKYVEQLDGHTQKILDHLEVSVPESEESKSQYLEELEKLFQNWVKVSQKFSGEYKYEKGQSSSRNDEYSQSKINFFAWAIKIEESLKKAIDSGKFILSSDSKLSVKLNNEESSASSKSNQTDLSQPSMDGNLGSSQNQVPANVSTSLTAQADQILAELREIITQVQNLANSSEHKFKDFAGFMVPMLNEILKSVGTIFSENLNRGMMTATNVAPITTVSLMKQVKTILAFIGKYQKSNSWKIYKGKNERMQIFKNIRAIMEKIQDLVDKLPSSIRGKAGSV